MKIDKPVLGKLTQGTIFTGAKAENYLGEPTWGLCITARCDMARGGKAHVFNYLPIVSVDTWMLRDGARLLADRLHSELLASAANTLKNSNKSPSVLDSYPIDFIAANILPQDAGFRKLADKIQHVEKFRDASSCTFEDIAALARLNIKSADRLMKELWSLQLAGYYFLKDLGPTEHECSTGYVILLREVHHLPQSLSVQIADGLLIDDEAKKKSNLFENTAFDFASPTGLVASPWIEHIMQSFSLLFSRIGLPDPNPSYLVAINERLSRGS